MKVNPLFLLSGAGMIAAGAGAVLYWALKKKLSIVPFLLGGAAWFVSVALKAGFAIAFNGKVQSLLNGWFRESAAGPLFWLYIGLLTGIFECGLVLLVTLWPKVRDYDFNQAVAFGAGFGATEAILLGLGSFAAVIAAMVMPDKMPKVLMDSFSGSAWVIPAPVVERVFAVIVHVFSCVLILQGARQKRWPLFWASFIYKTLIDAIAAWSQLSFKVDTLGHIWAVEAIVAAFGVIGLLGLIRLQRQDQQGVTDTATIMRS